MKTAVFLASTFVFMCGCSMLQPTGYVEQVECGVFPVSENCLGYSSHQVAANVYQVTFEGNEFSSLKRTTDFAMLRCGELALESGDQYVLVDIIERRHNRSVSGSDGNISSTELPVTSITCRLVSEGEQSALNAKELASNIKLEYGLN